MFNVKDIKKHKKTNILVDAKGRPIWLDDYHVECKYQRFHQNPNMKKLAQWNKPEKIAISLHYTI